MTVLSIIARHAQNGETASQEELQDMTPLDIRGELFDHLHASGYILTTEDDRVGLLRDLHVTTVADLARDLGLSLGVSMFEETEPDPSGRGRTGHSKASGALPRMLQDLHGAETAILDRSLNDVIFQTSSKSTP